MNFGISQSYISRLEKKIINKMKKEIMSKTGQIDKRHKMINNKYYKIDYCYANVERYGLF